MKSFKIGDVEIRIPIIQGGMGVGVSLSGLASAVASQGGVGVISSAGLGLLYRKYSSDYNVASIYGLKEEIRKARNMAKGVIGVNIMVAMSNFADMAKTAIQEKVDVIFSGAGLPLDLPSFLTKECTTKFVPIVSSARAAKIICEKWINNYAYTPDAIVVEGPKAGGHLGYKENQIDDPKFSLEQILPEVVSVAKAFEQQTGKQIPVIAAGGIYDGADIHRMLKLGASGVQMGTRFVTTEECDADIAFKNTYIEAAEEDIHIIKSPVGMPGRAICSSFIDKVKDGLTKPKNCAYNCIKTCQVEKTPYCIMQALYAAFKGKLNSGYAFAGSNAWRAQKIETVKELFEKVQNEYQSIKEKQKA